MSKEHAAAASAAESEGGTGTEGGDSETSAAGTVGGSIRVGRRWIPGSISSKCKWNHQ